MKQLIEKDICKNIKLTKLEKIFVNTFAWFDAFGVFGVRKIFTKTDSEFKPSYERFNAITSKEKLKVMYFSKVERTKYLIYKKQEYGHLSKNLLKKELKTPCGWLRLVVASYH